MRGGQGRPTAESEFLRVQLIGADEQEAQWIEALLSGSAGHRFECLRPQSEPVASAAERRPPEPGGVDVALVLQADSTGIEAREWPVPSGVPIVLLSDALDEQFMQAALARGARGFVARQGLEASRLVAALLAAVTAGRELVGLQRERDLDRMRAMYDPLTSLANRPLFLDRLAQAMALARRNGTRLAVLFIDIDDFKLVNDTLGHSAGDTLLVALARMLEGMLRESDTATRLGGDEFALLLDDLHDELDAGLVAAKIIEALRKPLRVEERSIYCSVSIGIATVPSNGQEPQDLLKQADTAMYQAKRAGRNRYAFFTPDMNARAMRRAAIESGLRCALRDGDFSVHYQPFFDLRRGRVIGAEALLRWEHPQLGAVGPEEFIPMAEALGQIGEIGEWVLHTACRQARDWQQLGGEGFRIAVNVSPLQLHESDFRQTVQAVLDETGLSPKTLEIEITEGGLVRETGHMIETLRDLKRLGLHLSIDDFGTGYSALAYLKDLPVDILKIDRSFVSSLLTDPSGATIVEAIVQLAKGLNLATIAEGVEERDQLLLLGSYGCNRMQGYLFGRPVSAEIFRKWVIDPRFIWKSEAEDERQR